MIPDISDLRNEYKKRELSKDDLQNNPIQQFEIWLDEAIHSKVFEPTAMTLATVGSNNQPSARIVLLKNISESGFQFFTNYDSRKGNELKQNPKAALVFFWPELERQVRVLGTVVKLEEKISNKYFESRPERSRISAIISPQSKTIANRDFLEKKFEEFIESNQEIKRPQHWGGFCLHPIEIEFWQGRESRLHDRFKYTLKEKSWFIERLAP